MGIKTTTENMKLNIWNLYGKEQNCNKTINYVCKIECEVQFKYFL